MERTGYASILPAPVSAALAFDREGSFSANGVGVLCFLPFIKEYGVDEAIEGSAYPQTRQIGKLNSILAYLALKPSSPQALKPSNP